MKLRFLTKKEMKLITAAVGEAEKSTAGEIRVVVAKNSRKFKSENPVYDHAVSAFHKYGLTNTKDKTGVLIFLSIKEHRIQILADTGINAKVEQTVWDSMVSHLATNIVEGNTCPAIIDVVKKSGEILAQHFPIQSGDVNELPNEVVVEK